MQGVGLDTALARYLERTGALPREALLAALEEARARRALGGDLALGVTLVARGLLSREQVEAALAGLRAGVEPAAAAQVGPYRVVRELGRGGMGVVHEVEHEQTGARYALKRLHPGADPEERERFAREVEAQLRLDHPGLVRIHAAELARPDPYLVLELVSGGSLADRLQRGGPLRPEAARALVLELADALAYLHEHGVLHRDLKPQNVLLDTRRAAPGVEEHGASGVAERSSASAPANVLLDPGGRPRLSDFGLARLQGAVSLTVTGELLGTPAYMPPEQVEDSRRVDARADVYALGGVLYAALTGEAPFLGNTPFAVLDAVLHRDPPSLLERAPGCPPDLAEACARALAKDPDDRPQSARELARLLEVRGAGARRRLPWLAAALLVAGGLGLGAWSWAGRGPAHAPKPPATPSPAWTGTPAAGDGDRLARLAARYERDPSPGSALELGLELERRGRHAEALRAWRAGAAVGQGVPFASLARAREAHGPRDLRLGRVAGLLGGKWLAATGRRVAQGAKGKWLRQALLGFEGDEVGTARSLLIECAGGRSWAQLSPRVALLAAGSRPARTLAVEVALWRDQLAYADQLLEGARVAVGGGADLDLLRADLELRARSPGASATFAMIERRYPDTPEGYVGAHYARLLRSEPPPRLQPPQGPVSDEVAYLLARAEISRAALGREGGRVASGVERLLDERLLCDAQLLWEWSLAQGPDALRAAQAQGRDAVDDPQLLAQELAMQLSAPSISFQLQAARVALLVPEHLEAVPAWLAEVEDALAGDEAARRRYGQEVRLLRGIEALRAGAREAEVLERWRGLSAGALDHQQQALFQRTFGHLPQLPR
ncbi:MAG: protein kinase [Planctomycetota bacterium]